MSTTATHRRGPRPRAPKGWMFERPRLAASISTHRIAAARLAFTNRKAAASRAGLKPDVIDKIIADDVSSRVRRYDELFVACDNPEALNEHHEVLAMRTRYASWDRARCEERLGEIRCELEPVADAKAKAAALRYQNDCAESRAAWREAMHAENTLQREAMALCDRLDEIDQEREP